MQPFPLGNLFWLARCCAQARVTTLQVYAYWIPERWQTFQSRVSASMFWCWRKVWNWHDPWTTLCKPWAWTCQSKAPLLGNPSCFLSMWRTRAMLLFRAVPISVIFPVARQTETSILYRYFSSTAWVFERHVPNRSQAWTGTENFFQEWPCATFTRTQTHGLGKVTTIGRL